MAGISKTRIDYGDQGPVKKTDDKDVGGGLKSGSPSIAQPTRAQLPVSGTDDELTSSSSAAKPATRPNTGK